MIRLRLIPVFFLFLCFPGNACTTFCLNKNGHIVFGRNFDWVGSTGHININYKNTRKTARSMPDGVPAQWISKYNSITFNQYGREFPMGGMNEKGLVVELMWVDGTKYSTPDSRSVVSDLQWIQYQLDNAATINEVIESDKIIRISSSFWSSPLHFLIADAKGNAASIEFFEGKLVVHKDNDLPRPVLTNSPYSASLQFANEKLNTTSETTTFQSNSFGRFATTCSMLQQYQANDIQTPVVDYAFEILDKVAQKNFTVWSIVYDITNLKIHFKSVNHQTVKEISFSSIRFICESPLIIDINNGYSGSVSGNFEKYSTNENRKMIDRILDIVDKQKVVTDAQRQEMAEYPEKFTSCVSNLGNAADYIKKYIQPYVETNNFSGVVLLKQGGNIIFNERFGMSDFAEKKLFSENSTFHIASISKMITAVAILKLEEDGKLKLIDPISKYVKNFHNGDLITIHHLMSQTSGIENINSMHGYNRMLKSHGSVSLERVIAKFRRKKQNFSPGEKYQLSNSNYNLLAYIIEKASGKNYGQYLAETFFEPLGLKNIGHNDPNNISSLATGYEATGSDGLVPSKKINWTTKTGNGSLYTTAMDLMKWADALFFGKIINEEQMRKMFSVYKGSFGYGCFLDKYEGQRRAWINGRAPGFSSYLVRLPDVDITLIVLSNVYSSSCMRIGDDISSILLNGKETSAPISLHQITESEAGQLTGVYKFDDSFYRPGMKMKVSFQNGYIKTDWGLAVPGKRDQFFTRYYWYELKFERNSNGEVVKAIIDGFEGKKVK